MPTICPYCKGEVPEGASKCMHCGEWLTPQPQPQADSEPEKPQPVTVEGEVVIQPFYKRHPIWVALCVIVVITLFVSLFSRNNDDSREVARNLMLLDHQQWSSDTEAQYADPLKELSSKTDAPSRAVADVVLKTQGILRKDGYYYTALDLLKAANTSIESKAAMESLGLDFPKVMAMLVVTLESGSK